MCGIAGLWRKKKGQQAVAQAMVQVLKHRGPDAVNTWFDDQAGLALAHTRLAVIDLSEAGQQPMFSASKRYVISYNGEIYNFPALRKELEALSVSFQGHSDTEILLAAIEQWGLKVALQKANGMFAFALWDTADKKLYLARDRFGEKPLFYGFVGGDFVFASELKAIKQATDKLTINRQALAQMLQLSAVPMHLCIYNELSKLRPGYIACVDFEDQNIDVSSYWSVEQSIGQSQSWQGDFTSAVDHLDGLMADSVQSRMIADVPLGVFLSGGFDSTLISWYAQQNSSNPIQTFSIGFAESTFDESPYAKAVAQHLGTDHHELIASEQDCLNIIPNLSSMYDEPFGDSSQIPTFLVSQLARQRVTVSLSGDGGDEMFAGYYRYFWMNRLWQRFGKFPFAVRRAIGQVALSLPTSALDGLYRLLNGILSKKNKVTGFADKVHKVGQMLKASSEPYEMYSAIKSTAYGHSLVLDAGKAEHGFLEAIEALSLTENLLQWDLQSYMPDDILVKVDRASMANSLEVRAPFLDPDLLSFAWSLPMDFKIRHGEGKHILKQLLYRHVPKSLMDRPKQGFGIPLRTWLKGPLRDWAEDLLSENALKQQGYFDAKQVQKLWQQQLTGRHNWQAVIWNILMFQEWLKNE